MLTSRNEGSPVALIEAMAAGRPVVGTRVGGVPELVGDAGLLADAGDVDGLGRAVLRLLRDPGFAADLGRRGQARVATDYGRGRFLRDLDGLYSRLLASSRAAGLP
jgi:glycosyltransferase involved in cell wall biosynthesis